MRKLRQQKGWSAQQLAEACARAGLASLSRSTISKIESGIRRSVTAEEVAVLAHVFEVTPTDLMASEDGPPIDFFISYSPADERWATWIAWQLEAAGHRTLIQAWDFVPGTNFIDFLDRGVRDSAVVVAILSRNYLKSRYGSLEWQAALRTDWNKLIPVRVEDCPLVGLLTTITWVDLVDITDSGVARNVLLSALRHALARRVKPADTPAVSPHPTNVVEVLRHDDDGTIQQKPEVRHAATSEQFGALGRTRHIPVPPSYPADSFTPQVRQEAIVLLHVSGPRFGRGMAEPINARDLQDRIWANVTHLTGTGAPHPDLILITGDLMESGRPRERDEALKFLTGLRVLLGLEPDRLLIVPGGHDVSKTACQAYFLQCESRDEEPQQPYFPKLENYARLFNELYEGCDGPLFDIAQPWTLFTVPELRVAVAGLNSTMAASHRTEDDYGWIGEEQAAWFAKRLQPFEDSGWLRVGFVRHDPDSSGRLAGSDPDLLRDADTLDQLLGSRLNVLMRGPSLSGTNIQFLGSGLPVMPATGPGQEEIIQVTADGLRRFSAYGDSVGKTFSAHLERRWHAVGGAFPAALTGRLHIEGDAHRADAE
jgi:3',5'-cyclic AMP phosphodiesterase CpdA/transcriptional regulator with XRE-family HTH domain